MFWRLIKSTHASANLRITLVGIDIIFSRRRTSVRYRIAHLAFIVINAVDSSTKYAAGYGIPKKRRACPSKFSGIGVKSTNWANSAQEGRYFCSILKNPKPTGCACASTDSAGALKVDTPCLSGVRILDSCHSAINIDVEDAFSIFYHSWVVANSKQQSNSAKPLAYILIHDAGEENTDWFYVTFKVHADFCRGVAGKTQCSGRGNTAHPGQVCFGS